MTFCRSNAKRPLMEGNAWSICWGIAAHLNVAALDAHRTAGVERIVWRNSQNDRSRKSRFRAPNLFCAGTRHDEAHGRATRGKDRPRGRTPAEFSFKAVYGRLNCDRREKSSFSTQST